MPTREGKYANYGEQKMLNKWHKLSNYIGKMAGSEKGNNTLLILNFPVSPKPYHLEHKSPMSTPSWDEDYEYLLPYRVSHEIKSWDAPYLRIKHGCIEQS